MPTQTRRVELPIKQSSRADEVQDFVGFRDEQWHRFYWLTKEEGRRIMQDHPEWKTWAVMPASTRIELRERVNQELIADNIPPVNEAVIRWRMTSLIREMARKRASREFELAQKAVEQLESQQEEMAPDTQATAGSRAYDPVRDL